MGEMEQNPQVPVERTPSAPIEIAARPQWLLPFLLGVIPIGGALLVGMVLLSGVFHAFIVLAFLCIAMALIFSVTRWVAWSRLWIDDDAVTLGPYRDPPFLRRPRRLRFTWSEVKCVRASGAFLGRNARGLTIVLNRHVAFETMQRHPTRKIIVLGDPWFKVLIPAELGRDPRFIDAVRAHVPSDRIALGALRSTLPPFPYPRILGGAYAILALLAGWIAWRLSDGDYTSLVGWVAIVTLGLMALVQSFSVGIERAEVMVSHGAGHMIMVASSSLLMLSLFAPLRAAGPAAAGGTAAMFLCLSALVLVPSRRRAWQRATSVCAAFAIGAVAGWFSYTGICGKPVCEGEMRGDAWTPDGAHFLLHLTPHTLTSTNTVQWFTRDGRADAVAVVPGAFWTDVMSSSGAIVRGTLDTTKGSPRALWFVPIAGKPQMLLSGERIGASGSWPNRHFALLSKGDETQTELHLLDLATVQTRRCGVIPSPSPRRRMGLSDDGRIYWMVGSPPLLGSKSPPSRTNSIPPDGKYFDPGKPYSIYTTGADIDGPRAVLYTAATPWIDWVRDSRSLSILACRLSASAPFHLEYVRIDFSAADVIVSAISESEFAADAARRPDEYRHDDYAITPGDSLRPPRLVHRPTGRSRPIECAGAWFVGSTAWSPDGRSFLASSNNLRLRIDAVCWRRSPDEFVELFAPITYLIDCDKAFGVE